MLADKISKLNLEELDLDFFNFEEENEQEGLEEELDQAREEWKEAKQYFNFVSDPELIEHAIYLLEAAEKKYNYLLKKQKKNSEKQ